MNDEGRRYAPVATTFREPTVARSSASRFVFMPALSGLPDPALYRQELPSGIRRAWDWGEISAAEVWARLERLWGTDEVVRFIEGRRDRRAA